MDETKITNSVIINPTEIDVFETAELPEDDQHGQIVLNDAAQPDCVEPIGVNIQQAFDQFRGKALEASDVDFSDDISRIRYSGYSAKELINSMDCEFGKGEESLEQKCLRLQQELRQLAKEMELIKENEKSDSFLAGMSPVELINQTEYLKRQMIDLTVENQLGIPSSTSLCDPREALQRRLLTELNGFNVKPETKTQVALKSNQLVAENSDHVNYQLFYRPEQAKFCNNARIADFEQRIERLEAVLGQSPEKLSLLTSELSNKTLMSSLCLLLAKMKVLDSGHLDVLEPRLASVCQKVSRTAEKKEAADETERLSKITDLYEAVKKWDSMANAVPHIVDRLTVLKEGQLRALQVSETLVNLDLAQRQMIDQLSGDKSMLKQFQSLVAETVTLMESNTKSLEQRLSSVQKK